jgi:hypothetical protein
MNETDVRKDEESHPDNEVATKLNELIDAIIQAKPGDRSELDRRYQILKIDTEKAQGFFDSYILRRDYWPKG